MNSKNEAFTVSIIQGPCAGDREVVLGHFTTEIRRAAKEGAQIICLPELCHARYFCSTESHDNFALAEPIPGPLTERFQKLAKELNTVLIIPMFERRAPGIYHNSAAVIDADGSLLGTYRKMHIPDDPLYYEKFYFTPGDATGNGSGYQVFKTKYATIGVLICWDQWYPEGARMTALLGAEILFYPTAIGWHPAEKAEMGAVQLDAWRTIQRSHAIANGIYVASVNRVGFEPTPGTDGIEFFGNSFIAGPFGQMLAEADHAENKTLTAICVRNEMEAQRQYWPFMRDRRVDSFGGLTKRYLDN